MGRPDDSEPKRPDPRTERTISALWRALVELIGEKGYEAASVREIAQRARVNRATFYRYFEDKDDLLRQGTVELVESLLRSMRMPDAHDPRSAIDSIPEYFARMFSLIHDEWGTLKILCGDGSSPEFRNIISDKIESFIIEQRLRPWFSSSGLFEDPDLAEAYACTIAGTLVRLALWWLDRPEPLPPERVSSIYKTIIVGSMKELLADDRRRGDEGAPSRGGSS